MIDPEQPVQNPDHYIGQRAVVRRIFSRIGAERPQSVAVIGGTKTGKTSLLNHIAHQRIRAEHLEQLDSYRFCHVDASETLFGDAESFMRGINRMLENGGETAENCYHALQRTVEDLHGRGCKVVLLLDDFHLITSNSSFPLEFFSFLRSLANNYNLAYVTSSFLELQKLCVVKDIEESPFFNIFTNLSLGPLSTGEGETLLESLGRTRDAEQLSRWCGAFPYALKLAARFLARQNAEIRDGAEAEKLLLPVLTPYFEKVVAILPAEALNPLKSIARDKSPDPREAHVLRPLIKQGFLLESDDAVRSFAPSFGAFLRKSLNRKLLQG